MEELTIRTNISHQAYVQQHMSHLVDVSQQSITYIGQSDAGRNW